MPEPNEPLEPTPFEAAPAATLSTAHATGASKQGLAPWIWPALGGLLLLALLVVFWLPGQLQQEESAATTNNEQSAAPRSTADSTSPVPDAATPEATPWSDAQLARLRKEAQTVLGDLLDAQFALEERGVQQWAPERFTKALALAASGDTRYKDRKFEQATVDYQQGLNLLQQLQEALPEEFERQVARATTAIEQRDESIASAAIALATVLEPDRAELAALTQRVQALPQLITALEAAATEETRDQLEAAIASLQQATTLDPLHQYAEAELRRVSHKWQRQRFNNAMSEGYVALDANRFEQARSFFRNAATIQPGSTEAASARQDVEHAATAYRLAALKKRGQAYEQQEQWQQAVEAYEQARKIDGSVLFAGEGLQRSRSRAVLATKITTLFENPQRLADIAVAEGAEELLRTARQTSPSGAVLNGQIAKLDTILQQANTQVAVTLLSDQQTNVIVYKVARLGEFQQHQLSLRPGSYTAVGSRKGYRDVRQQFSINHDQASATLTIICTEPI